MKVTVLTSDTHNWLLKGFFHQWEKYGKSPAVDYLHDPLALEVAGFTDPGFLPKGVPFFSIGKFTDYPVQKWSDGLIRYLNTITDDLVILLLEDYWLIRQANRGLIYTAAGYMIDHPEVIRFDLSSDRMFNKEARYVGSIGLMDICEVKADYSISFQAAIWRRDLLLQVLKPGETPWEAELNGSRRLNQLPYRVVGSYQWPINYLIACNKGKLDREGGWMFPSRTLKTEDWKELDVMGALKEPKRWTA